MMSGARRQAIVTALVGIVALSLGNFVGAVLLGGFTWTTLSVLVPQVHTLVWAVVVALALPSLARAGGGRLAGLAIVVAPVVAVVAALVQQGGQGGIVFVVAGWTALTLTSAAAVGAIAGALDARSAHAPVGVGSAASVRDDGVAEGSAPETLSPSDASAVPNRREWVLSVAIMVSIVVAAAAAFALPAIWLGVYFSIWDAAPPPTADEIMRYEWAAGVAVAASVLAVVIAVVRRRAGLIIASTFTLLFGLGAAFVFQVPTGRFVPEPAPVVVDDDYPVCFGTTGDCPGG